MRLAIADPPYPPQISERYDLVDVPPARRRRPAHGQIPDVLHAAAPGDGFAGSKPAIWTRWILDALGHDPENDTVDDLFPGSGAVTAAIEQGVLL